MTDSMQTQASDTGLVRSNAPVRAVFEGDLELFGLLGHIYSSMSAIVLPRLAAI